MKSLKLKNLIWVAVPVLLTMAPMNALAGNSSGGGGDLVGNDLLDFAEMKSLTEIDPTQLPAYQSTVAPVLENIAKLLPGFSERLVRGLVNKKWYFENRSLGTPTDNGSRARNQKRLAQQDKHRIRVNRALFTRIPERVQGEMIVHELVRAYAMEKGGIDEESIREITRTLFSDPIATSSQEFIDKLAEYGFGNAFVTIEDTQRSIDSAKIFTQNVCRAPDGEVEKRLDAADEEKVSDFVYLQYAAIDYRDLRPSLAFSERVSDASDIVFLIRMSKLTQAHFDPKQIQKLKSLCPMLEKVVERSNDETASAKVSAERGLASMSDSTHVGSAAVAENPLKPVVENQSPGTTGEAATGLAQKAR